MPSRSLKRTAFPPNNRVPEQRCLMRDDTIAQTEWRRSAHREFLHHPVVPRRTRDGRRAVHTLVHVRGTCAAGRVAHRENRPRNAVRRRFTSQARRAFQIRMLMPKSSFRDIK